MNLNQLDILLPFSCKYRVEVFAKIAWPASVDQGKKRFWKTGKVGTNTKTKLPAAEYDHDDERVWLLSDGTIVTE